MIVHSEGLMLLDEYLYVRVHVIRRSQILISEKFLFIGSKRQLLASWKMIVKNGLNRRSSSPKHKKAFFKNSKKSLRNVKRKVIVSVKKRVLQKFEVPLDVHAA